LNTSRILTALSTPAGSSAARGRSRKTLSSGSNHRIANEPVGRHSQGPFPLLPGLRAGMGAETRASMPSLRRKFASNHRKTCRDGSARQAGEGVFGDRVGCAQRFGLLQGPMAPSQATAAKASRRNPLLASWRDWVQKGIAVKPVMAQPPLGAHCVQRLHEPARLSSPVTPAATSVNGLPAPRPRLPWQPVCWACCFCLINRPARPELSPPLRVLPWLASLRPWD